MASATVRAGSMSLCDDDRSTIESGDESVKELIYSWKGVNWSLMRRMMNDFWRVDAMCFNDISLLGGDGRIWFKQMGKYRAPNSFVDIFDRLIYIRFVFHIDNGKGNISNIIDFWDSFTNKKIVATWHKPGFIIPQYTLPWATLRFDLFCSAKLIDSIIKQYQS